MARRSDGPWILNGQSNNCNHGNNSFGVGNANYGGSTRGAGDVYDMKGYAVQQVECLPNTPTTPISRLVAALCNTQDTTADVARTLARCKFSPRLPGLTKLVSKFGKEGCWRKALGVYESLHILNIVPDTAITNAAISACDKGTKAPSWCSHTRVHAISSTICTFPHVFCTVATHPLTPKAANGKNRSSCFTR